ncbi:MAG: hypothetical protein H6807_14695 [Planctomycetes bacterium]|nr:hypothetical protein [Planctomycetota bacterium]
MKSSPRTGSPTLTGVLATLVTIAVLASVAGAQIKSLSRFKAEEQGFELKVPVKWDQIPPQPDEAHVMAKWAADSMKKGTGESWEFQVMRFVPRSGTTESGAEAVPEEGGMPPEIDRKELMKRFMEASRPTSFVEYYERLNTKAKLSSPEDLKIGREKGKLYCIPEFDDWNGGTSALVGVLDDGGREWVLMYLVPKKEVFPDGKEDAKTSVKTSILASISSFRLFEPKRRNQPSDVDLDTMSEIDRKILEVKDRLPASWEVLPTPKKQYVIVHNIPQKKTRQITFAKNIVKYLERMREHYESIFPPRKTIDAVSVVRVCQDREEYHQYGGPGGSAGYFSPATGELVIYDATSEGGMADSYSTLFHEAYHQYLYYAVGEVSAHRWFDEGYGDYFAGANPKKGFRIEPFDWRTGTVRQAVVEGKNVPLEKLIRYTQAEYYGNADVCYSQGWALVYFLKSDAAKKNDKWPGILQRYFDTLVETQRPDKAVDVAFEGVDISELDAAYCDFIKGGFK